MKKTIIGIDLGTTNCTVAWSKEGAITQFAIPQKTSAAALGEHFLLPSFIYFPMPEELKTGMAGEDAHLVGAFAKERGAEVPARLIASAKSWLCHNGIDRREKHLPTHAEEGFEKWSPLHATAQLLRHIKQTWDETHANAPFVDQEILITVPASFDPSARQLVQEAASLAGYPNVILLEEPLAAFYAWLHNHEEAWRKMLKVGDTVLVVDIGGGTTDFSLISVAEEGGNLALKRIAVGAHLLLGGDNIDLSLAYLAKAKLEERGEILSDWQMQSLVHAARKAKESLLGDETPESVEINLAGRGSRLIGGSLKTTLTRQEIADLIVNGFFPQLPSKERSKVEKKGAIQEIGLPYAQDARISCQLAKFLSMTGEGEGSGSQTFIIPTAVLFNGGTLKASALRVRLTGILDNWAEEYQAPRVKELSGADYDFGVSRGAVYYGLARHGKGLRVRSGASRSYFIGVEESVPAVPGIEAPLKAICVVPFGMEEGSEATLDNKEFTLLLGEQATFRFFSRSTPELPGGTVPVLGTPVKSWKQDLTELHTLDTFLSADGVEGKSVQVKLKSRLTELGVLELWCESSDAHKWKLEFDLR